jgi:subtilisin family serine protease
MITILMCNYKNLRYVKKTNRLRRRVKRKGLLLSVVMMVVISVFATSCAETIPEQNVPLSDAGGLSETQLEPLVVDEGEGTQADSYIVKMKDEAVSDETIENSPESEVIAGNCFEVSDLSQVADFVEHRNDIEFILPDTEITLMDIAEDGVPSDPLYAVEDGSGGYTYVQQSLHLMKPESAWHRNYFGQGVLVAVIDTGLNVSSDMRSANVLTGYNFVDDSLDTTDNNGHGTSVAGQLFTQIDNELGKAGVTDQVTLLPLKVTDSGSFSKSILFKAIDYAIECGAQVINLSCGSAEISTEEALIYDSYAARGVIIVAAAGNENIPTVCAPAAYDSVIGVGAMDYNKNERWVADAQKGSNYGAGLDAAVSYYPTSQATPYVTALAAMAKQYNKDYGVGDFRALISESCEDVGVAGRDDEYGYGLINYAGFIDKMTGSTEELSTIKSEPVDENISGAYLKSLKISGAKLTNKFSAQKFSYKVKAAKKKSKVTIKIQPQDKSSVVYVKSDAKGKYKKKSSLSLKLKDGKKRVVYIKCKNKSESKIYRVTISGAK